MRRRRGSPRVLAAVAALVSVTLAIAVGGALARAAGTPAHGHGTVLSLDPVGAQTAWALIQGPGSRPTDSIQLTDDGGVHFSVASHGLSHAMLARGVSFDVLSPTHAWLAVGSGPSHSTIESTSDAGQRWTRLGRTILNCTLQFVSLRDGWCVALFGAAGSEAVAIVHSTDGGRTWQTISDTTVPGEPGTTPGALPFRCDKIVTFTSPRDGLASLNCGGVLGYLYVSTDAGARWRRVLELRPPLRSGSLDTIDVTGRGGQLAVGETMLHPSRTEILRSADAGRRWTTIRSPDADQTFDVDIVTPNVWRLALGHTILATDDAGASWQRISSSVSLGSQPRLQFTTATDGWDVTPSGSLLFTSDDGRTWTAVSIPG